jgi:hypothetical protein
MCTVEDFIYKYRTSIDPIIKSGVQNLVGIKKENTYNIVFPYVDRTVLKSNQILDLVMLASIYRDLSFTKQLVQRYSAKSNQAKKRRGIGL